MHTEQFADPKIYPLPLTIWRQSWGVCAILTLMMTVR